MSEAPFDIAHWKKQLVKEAASRGYLQYVVAASPVTDARSKAARELLVEMDQAESEAAEARSAARHRQTQLVAWIAAVLAGIGAATGIVQCHASKPPATGSQNPATIPFVPANNPQTPSIPQPLPIQTPPATSGSALPASSPQPLPPKSLPPSAQPATSTTTPRQSPPVASTPSTKLPNSTPIPK